MSGSRTENVELERIFRIHLRPLRRLYCEYCIFVQQGRLFNL